MITFDRKKGLLFSATGAVIYTGIWSGHGDAHNDPSREREKMVGPLPAGVYHMGPAIDGGHLGPFVMHLVPVSGEQYGRGGFFWHGDHANDFDYSASDGCVISPLAIRQRGDQEPDRLLKVV